MLQVFETHKSDTDLSPPASVSQEMFTTTSK